MSSSNVTLRPAQLNDLDEILAIESRVFKIPWSRKIMNAELKNDLAHFYVAEIDSTIVGYTVYWDVGEEIHLLNIAVHGDYQRRGIGTILLNQVISAADHAGKLWIYLEVRPSNVAALQLYKRHHFFQIGRRPHYYPDGEDALIYCRRGPVVGN